MSLDGFSLSPLAAELHTRLVGSRIDKIFQPDKYTLIIGLRQNNDNLKLLISAAPENPRLHIASQLPENPAAPPAFCMLLRKHFETGRIAAVTQHSLDRVLRIDVDVRGEQGLLVTKSLIAEIMGKHSNIIFTQDQLIVDAVRRIGVNTSRVRQVLPGRIYECPPGQDGVNILEATPQQFCQELQKHAGTPLTKAIIACTIGLGPVTAREIVWRAGLPPELPVEQLEPSDLESLCESLDSLVRPLREEKPEPTVVFDEHNRLKGITPFPLEHLPGYSRKTFASMSMAVEFEDQLRGVRQTPEKELLHKLVATELAKLTRKRAVLTQEAQEAADADELRKCADLLMANVHTMPDHASEITVDDFYSENPETERLTIALDPLLTPLQNAQAYYHKYNKLKRAQTQLSEQLRQCAQDMAYIETVLLAINQVFSLADIADIRTELTAAGYVKDGNKRRQPVAPASPLTFVTANGATILIGKNNRQNDFVTFKQGKPEDYWFHTKDIPGSHVILHPGQEPASEQTLLIAANLAAYFSKSRQSANVPVDYTLRRHVKKPSGAKPGFVIYDHQQTLYVTPDESLVSQLLKK